ncbi:hypothetical protein GGP41_001811 [Bipolaris sorokiniana]|uniref:Uncharacterized protein n=2 Tax=Cochliobolus sativus TaxID=45130 RepID=A0A8H5ZSW3_COCSA|nr:uncharacterized protein COCSADRAFT_270975 [Bipolaris sorokiniana ND90Pr]EMD68264.1 hypothetical protein COCSADRAFT_270975 [Bipolaris sorokiniana ND90Pr]KAF5853243.1 hypothetical protein GGP41_001811 [Bipolaris sorokiniana]
MKLKMLNGAPRREHLDFSDSCLLPADECNGFSVAARCEMPPVDSTPTMKWRCLAKKDTRLQSEWQHPYLPGSILGSHMADISLPEVVQFQSFAQEDTTALDATVSFNDPTFNTDGLIEHSLVFHDSLLSSQVVPGEGPDSTINSSSFLSTSFETTTSDYSSPHKADQHTIIHVPLKLSITPLASLPSAQQLRAIYPQTPTPNFICVVTTSPEKREIFVRRGGYKMDLWEIIVADDSFSGFKTAFWMRPNLDSKDERTRSQRSLLEALQGIKVGDIILLTNVALTSFRDTVFGQSLNPAIARARTDIHVLMKSNGISAAQPGRLPSQVDEAFTRVKKWARMHVASDIGGSRKRKGSAPKQGDFVKRTFATRDLDDSMPPDTMESF